MVRIAKKTDPRRLSELKRKIDDDKYLTDAINRIANTLTNGILQMNEDQQNGN
jgi:hypothetical protein